MLLMRNCQSCGKAYTSSNPTTCPDCVEEDSEVFNTVRQFIKDNPLVSVDVVEAATGVPAERIREYLRQGRIEAAEMSGPMLECERCGKPIYAGQYCVVCQSEIQKTFRSASVPSPKKRPADAAQKKKSGPFVRRYRRGF